MTNQTSASFKYSDSMVSGYTFTRFACSLDGAAYAACGTTLSGSTQSYSGLSAGSHTFKVEAVYGSTTTAATSYSWTIDLTPPTLTSINRASGAKNPTNAGPLVWTVTFSEPVLDVVASNFGIVKGSGVTGSAPVIGTPTPNGGAAPQSVWTVSVSTTGVVGGSTNNTIELELNGPGTIQDQAGNKLSGTFPVAGQSFTYDTTPPPAPVISGHPSNPSTSTSASFTFSDSQAGVTLECSMDDSGTPPSGYSACTSPLSYAGLALGSHTFRVYAADQAGNLSPVASYTWTIQKASPTIATALSASAITVGGSVYDTASLTGANANAGGTVTYTLYTNSGCTTASTKPAVNQTVTVTGGSVPNSSAVTFTAPGTFYWQAVYSGDATDNSAKSACTSETLTVSKASPTLTTTPSPGVVVGGAVSDGATVSGGYSVNGENVTFTLYSDSGCTDQVYSSVNAISSGSAGSGSYTATQAGTYYWKASYPGDANNNAFTTSCGSSGETVAVSKATVSITTTPSAGGTVGGSITDTATLNGAYHPTGSVAFLLYSSPSCSLFSLVFVSANPLSGNSATSSPFTAVAPGTYYWQALYAGDGNNTGFVTGCGPGQETAVVGKATPSVTTKLSASSINVSGTAYDTSTLTGLVDSTGAGTVAYTYYTNNTCTQSPVAAGVKTVPTNGVVPNSNTITFNTTGTFYWQAVYSGDANNASASSPCNAGNNEQLTVVSTAGSPYTIGGNLTALLYPGAPAQQLNLTFNSTNSGNGGSGVNGTQVSNLTVAITSITGGSNLPTACVAGDFKITQIPAGAYPFYIPDGTNSLSSLIPAADLPTIQMIDNGTNQDGCEGATVHLSYTGTP